MKNILFIISFLFLLVSSTGHSEESPAAKIYFEEKSFDAGEIKSGDYLEHSFKVYNKGNATLEITDVKSS